MNTRQPKDWLPASIKSFVLADSSFNFPDERPTEIYGATLFGNHAWYFRVMTRGRGVLFEKREAFYGCIAPSWTDGRNGSWTRCITILRPLVSTSGLAQFVDTCKEVANETRLPVLFKQVHSGLVSGLLTKGLRLYASDEGWDGHYRYDEQNNAEVVLHLEGLRGLEPPSLTRCLHRPVKGMYDRFVVEEQDLSSPRSNWQSKLFSVFCKWRGHFAQRYPLLRSYEFVGWNFAAIGEIKAGGSERLFVATDNSDGEAVAFFYFTKASAIQWDMALSFCETRVNDLHRLLYLKALKILTDEGCQFVNMGGSEEIGLYRAKKRIWHSSDIHATHLVLDP